jgi:CheY-like chemotaxis protein
VKNSPSPLSVLVVDDVADAADSLAELLGCHGYAARAAHSGAEALRVAEAERPDVVILDLAMPAMDGWELAGLFSVRERAPRLICLSGIEEDPGPVERDPFSKRLAKPAELGVLVGELNRHADALGRRMWIPRWISDARSAEACV